MASWLVFPSKGWDVYSLSWRLQLGSFYDCPVMLAWLNECTGNSIGSTFHRGSLINSVYKTFKCLHNLAPGYLSRHCTSVASLPGRAHLRSATSGQLVVPSTRTMTLGNRGFHVSGPVSWNNLTPQLHDRTISLASFKKFLKTFLFRTQ